MYAPTIMVLTLQRKVKIEMPGAVRELGNGSGRIGLRHMDWPKRFSRTVGRRLREQCRTHIGKIRSVETEEGLALYFMTVPRSPPG
jgi:hypothetical protein